MRSRRFGAFLASEKEENDKGIQWVGGRLTLPFLNETWDRQNLFGFPVEPEQNGGYRPAEWRTPSLLKMVSFAVYPLGGLTNAASGF